MSIKQAIEALKIGIREINMLGGARQAMQLHEALAALRSMPAEPVAYADPADLAKDGNWDTFIVKHAIERCESQRFKVPLYTHPAPAQHPLTNKSPSPEYDRGFSDGWDRGHAHGIAAQKGTT